MKMRENIGHAKITQTDAFNYMSYQFLCNRRIRPARTEQFLVIFTTVSDKDCPGYCTYQGCDDYDASSGGKNNRPTRSR